MSQPFDITIIKFKIGNIVDQSRSVLHRQLLAWTEPTLGVPMTEICPQDCMMKI